MSSSQGQTRVAKIGNCMHPPVGNLVVILADQPAEAAGVEAGATEDPEAIGEAAGIGETKGLWKFIFRVGIRRSYSQVTFYRLHRHELKFLGLEVFFVNAFVKNNKFVI